MLSWFPSQRASHSDSFHNWKIVFLKLSILFLTESIPDVSDWCIPFPLETLSNNTNTQRWLPWLSNRILPRIATNQLWQAFLPDTQSPFNSLRPRTVNFLFVIDSVFSQWRKRIWVRSWRSGRLVARFCYQMIAKPGNKTSAPSWCISEKIPALVLLAKILFNHSWRTGGGLNTKMSSYQYKDPHVKDKMVSQPSNL